MTNNKKKIFITGSSSGIGLHLAKKLSLDKKNEIIINSRNLIKLTKAKKIISDCEYIKGDVSDYKIALKISKKIKKLDVLICNVGNSSSSFPGKERYQDWEKSFSDNFFSSVNIIKAFEKKLIKSKGLIICISSICGIEYVKGAPLTYSVSKAALNAFVRFYSKILGPKGARINAIAPGNILFKGSVWEKKIKKNRKKTLKIINDEVSTKKIGSPENVFNTVNYLISEKTNFINGSVFIIDGGQIRSL